MKIAYLTAGAAGMYCGSCLHDNALAKALIELGHDTILLPTYTPILTDESSVSSSQLFYGGINVYLQQASAVFRRLPKWADAVLSSPRFVGWIASRAMGTSADGLGPLTVSMLQGADGNQRKEVDRLCDWLVGEKPDVVVFSNLLIAGAVPEIRRRLGCPCAVVLQGDDIFYESLPPPYREQAVAELQRLAGQVDLFVVHSQDYGTRMQQMLKFPVERLGVCPLTIDVADFESLPESAENNRPPTIGYLARIAPEKGLHLLAEAFEEVAQALPAVELQIAGWLGKQHEEYWQGIQDRLKRAGLEDRFHYHGSVDRAGKLDFLQQIDVLCVPTTYQEPKGLFVLEGLAAGVPYVQPSHGAFPEIHARMGGGHLIEPESREGLAERLVEVLSDRDAARALGAAGRKQLFESATTRHEAERFATLLAEVVS